MKYRNTILTLVLVVAASCSAHADFFTRNGLNVSTTAKKINGELEINGQKFNKIGTVKNNMSTEQNTAFGYSFDLNEKSAVDLEVEYSGSSKNKRYSFTDNQLPDLTGFVEEKISRLMFNGYYTFIPLTNNAFTIKPFVMAGLGVGQYSTKIGANFDLDSKIDLNIYFFGNKQKVHRTLIGQTGIGIAVPISKNMEIVGLYSFSNKIPGSSKKIQNIGSINDDLLNIDASASIQKSYLQQRGNLSLKIRF
ncbi:exported hypothetical protein [Candidatus Xenohaliotis californiensis]|uniref:Outer membrane protein beta-barrel domain-containing protein n=1 Tax=Candidatus Xenohaliotis californiensis TaxID=84677 RepID=A0ABM9N6X1_9RICK|nr:exported hypothetical protein [Candidatus Xenohaliotis californiensis]